MCGGMPPRRVVLWLMTVDGAAASVCHALCLFFTVFYYFVFLSISSGFAGLLTLFSLC